MKLVQQEPTLSLLRSIYRRTLCGCSEIKAQKKSVVLAFAGMIQKGLLQTFLSLILLMPALAAAQTDLPDLTHKLTALTPRLPAPNFALKDLDGKTQRLSDYKGRVVLVNFWATWCPPCRREMPSMERLYQKLINEPFMVLAPDQYENFDLVFSFTGQLDPAPTFPIMLDENSVASKAWKVKGLPTSFIVDKQGRIAYRAVGGREFDHPEIEKLIRALIAE